MTKPDLSGIWDKGLLPQEVPPPSLFSGSGPSQAFRDLKAALPGDLPMLPWAAQLKDALRTEQQRSPRRALSAAAPDSGRWDGESLVVETTGFKDQTWIDEHGTPASDRLRLTERFRRINFGTLEIQVTVDDSKTFTRPFTFTLQQRLVPDTELIEFVCGENNLSAARLFGH
jgi:hypothetical protein